MSVPVPLSDPSQLTISMAGRVARVEFAGLVAPGLYQFNVAVPDGDQR